MGRFDNYKFHCSSIGSLMTEARTKGDLFGETCKAHMLECWIEETYGRTKDLTNQYVEKGNLVEEDSMTLYSRVTKRFYTKNLQQFENEFICGTPDIINNREVIDLKSSWSIHTFYGCVHKAMNKDYLWQINGYMDLIPCDTGKLVYVLVNTPDVIVEQEKSKLRYKMGLIDPESNGVYQMAASQIEKNNNFDDIPISSRYMEFDVARMDMSKVYDKIKACRIFMNELSEPKLAIA